MTQTANNYGKVLFELGITKETVEETKQVLAAGTELGQILAHPLVSRAEKSRVIKRVFPKEMWNFFEVLCEHGSVAELPDIFCAYEKLQDQKDHIIRAKLYYVTPPTQEQTAQIVKRLEKRYEGEHIILEQYHKPELTGGFVLRVGDIEEDWSIRGRLHMLQQKLTWR